jgi:hypothetical protein
MISIQILSFFIQSLFISAPAANCPEPDAGPDLLICDPGQAVQINASINGSYDRFYWEPSTGLTPPNSLNPTAIVNQTTTYRLVVESRSNVNLITNGNFAGGNSGFTSEYRYRAPGTGFTWGDYSVHNRPSDLNGAWSNCPDATGDGMMLICDGATSPGLNFWCQTVTVQPNTNYEFSFQGTSVYPASPALVVVKFNGAAGGGPYGFSGSTCQWLRFTTTWNSGPNTSVEICLENTNTIGGGNDFAVDDIRLHELCEREDEVTIEVVEMQADPGGPYELTCDIPVIQLDGSLSSQGPDYRYEWRTFNGNIRSGANTLFPVVDRPGTYILTLFGPGGCEKQVAVEVFGKTEEPEITTLTADSIGCGTDSIQLFSIVDPPNQGYQYTWSGPGSFISQEEAPWVRTPGTYYVVVEDIYGCSGIDSVTVEKGAGVPALRPFLEDTLSCKTDTVQLRVDPWIPGQNYAWTGPNGFQSNEAEPVVRDTGWYYVRTWEDPACPARDSIRVTSDLATFTVTISGDTLSCKVDTVPLTASFDLNKVDSWIWYLPDGSTRIDTMLTTPLDGWHFLHTLYENGCVHIDSFRVERDSSLLTFSLDADTITCAVPEASILANLPAGALGISWNGPGNYSSDQVRDTVSLPGWYVATVTGENGCNAIDSVLVERSGDVPVIELLSDTFDCNNTQFNLRWNSPDANLIFQWTGPGGFQSSDPNPAITESGVYYLVLSNPQNCRIVDSVEIQADLSEPAFSITEDSISCAHPMATIALMVSGGTPGQVEWLDGSGTVMGTGSRFTTSTGGSYTVRVTGANGCEKDSTFFIRENKSVPDISLSGDTITCLKNDIWIRLDMEATAGSGQWSGPGIRQVNGDSVLVDAGGEYEYTFTGDNGCITSEQITIPVDTVNPVFTLRGDTLLHCLKDQAAISVMGQQSGWTITWIDSSGKILGNSPDLIVSDPGTYRLVVIDPVTGCDAEKSWAVWEVFPPQALDIRVEDPACFEDQGSVSVLQVTGGSGPYQFDIGGTRATAGQALALDPGAYSVRVTDALGCVLEKSFRIADRVDPVLSLTASIQVIPGQSIWLRPVLNLDSTALASIQWMPAGKVSCPNCLSTVAMPDVSETFTLTVTDTSGCTVSASVFFNLRSPRIFIPNAFSPLNKDGVNDFFLPNTGEGILVESMSIFDRWGNRVWVRENLTSNAPNEGWDGSIGDRSALPGVYVYRIVFRMPDGSEEFRTGDVTLVH